MATTAQDAIARLTDAFDFHDPDYTPEVAEVVNRTIRDTSAVSYSSAHGGFWILSRYDDVKAALKDHETFSSAFGVHFPRSAGMPKFSPIDYDPPEHRAIRKVMSPPVERETVRRLEPSLRQLAADLVEPIVARGHGDLVAELARPFAIQALGLAIGLSESAQGAIRELTRNMWSRLSRDSDSSKFWPQYRSLISDELRRAREGGESSYLAQLADAQVDGRPISEDMLYSIAVSYCVAGHDNTMNAVSRMLWVLGGDANLQERLEAEPDLIAGVAEETLRRWCPTDRFTRVTTRDVTIDGVTIPAGSRVVLLFDAANRDPGKFADPDAFCADRREANQHLSFGQGIHHCLGAHLARAEFRAVLGELVRQPRYHLVDESRRYFENGRHIMFDRILVRFEQRTAPAPRATPTRRLTAPADAASAAERLVEMTSGLWVSQTLVAAESVGLFTFLSDEAGATVREVSDGLGIAARPAEVLLTACAALGLLEWDGERFVNAAVAEEYLVRGQPYYLGDYVRMLGEYAYPAWMRITDAIRSDSPSRAIPREEKGIFDADNRPQLFWDGIYPLSALTARALAQAVDFGMTAKLLDVGGGAAAFAIELCRRYPALRATVYDLPHVCELASDRIRAAGMRERIGVHLGDFFEQDLPLGHDTILLSMVLHDWDEQHDRELLAKCFEALPTGGTIVISELLVDDDKTGPLNAALMSMNMLVGTPGRNYTALEYSDWLRITGFAEPRTVRFRAPGANGAVIARKP